VVGKSKPVSRLTRVVLPAPFGPIRPTTSCRCSSRETPRTAWIPSKERETAVARRVSPGHPFAVPVSASATRPLLEADRLLRLPHPEVGLLVVLHLHDSPGPPRDAVQRRGVRDRPGDGRLILEVLDHPRELGAVSR